jgi:hypothetical protein
MGYHPCYCRFLLHLARRRGNVDAGSMTIIQRLENSNPSIGSKTCCGNWAPERFSWRWEWGPRHQLGFEELQCYVHCLWHPAWQCLAWSLMIKFNSWHQHWNWAVITNIMLVQRWQLCVFMHPLL